MSNDKDTLLKNRDNGWLKINEDEKEQITLYSKDYIKFLTNAKTERLAHDMAVKFAEEKGFVSIDTIEDKPGSLKAGDKIYRSYGGRTILFTIIGNQPAEKGFHIVGGHIDAPRLDLKPNPLYEDSEMAMLDTHYYGGIKKYQWVTIPLAMHGVVVKEDGTRVNIQIGEEPTDPVFTITDLLPHLGKDQAKKALSEAITGEGLNILFGSMPSTEKDAKSKVKENILNLLNEKYGIKEEDFVSADIEIVPAGPARELGFDRSMVLGYGQDDRCCAFASLKAMLDMEEIPEHTSMVLLCDKEEIGSVGATGMQSFFFENSVAEIISRTEENYSDLKVRRSLENSRMLSADVNSLHDPNYPEVSSPNENMAKINKGVVLCKYTGSRGKSGASEASAEFMGEMRKLFNDGEVLWQSTEMGKVDAGGGGTIALFMSRYGMDVLDCGPGLLSMHAPYEVASKLDLYMSYKAYKVFLNDKRNK